MKGFKKEALLATGPPFLKAVALHSREALVDGAEHIADDGTK